MRVRPLVVEVERKSWPHVRQDRFAVLRHVESEYECWEEEDAAARGAFCLDVAPDALHKANISGGAPYGFLVPDACADATFRFLDNVRIPFVSYLGLAFAHGGFPGMRGQDVGDRASRARRELADGLEPL